MHHNSIQIFGTANGILVTVPTKLSHYNVMPGFNPRVIGDIAREVQNPPDELDRIQQEAQEAEAKLEFDESAIIMPGTYQFTNINKALEFVRLLLTGECTSTDEAMKKVKGFTK